MIESELSAAYGDFRASRGGVGFTVALAGAIIFIYLHIHISQSEDEMFMI